MQPQERRESLIRNLMQAKEIPTYKACAEYLGISDRHLRRFRKNPDRYKELDERIRDDLKNSHDFLIMILETYDQLIGRVHDSITRAHSTGILHKIAEKGETPIHYFSFDRDTIKPSTVYKAVEAFQELQEQTGYEGDLTGFCMSLLEHVNTAWKGRVIEQLDIMGVDVDFL